MTRVTPVLSVRGAEQAIDSYRRAFNAVETHRSTAPDGRIVAEL